MALKSNHYFIRNCCKTQGPSKILPKQYGTLLGCDKYKNEVLVKLPLDSKVITPDFKVS
jgi:hypothetical protein